MRSAFLLFLFISVIGTACAQDSDADKKRVLTGAQNMDAYLPMLKGKKVGVIVNQSSLVHYTPLLDTLLSRNVKVTKIFVPEHGFRGNAEAGQLVKNEIDFDTKLPIISLYGKNKKPTPENLKGIDVLIYDLQDVGTRFYTYISTLQYAMEACAENGKKLIVLDRPNPNGFYVDGPVLDTSLRSFVGMQPIPIVYGMTCGEYAKMLVGEKWFKGSEKLDMEVILCTNYDHSYKYQLPVPPSPNLKNMAAVYLYPSLCLFEGTPVSIGRGTGMPFQVFGHPDFYGKASGFSFTPRGVPGPTEPQNMDRENWGRIIALDTAEAFIWIKSNIRLIWIKQGYEWFPFKDNYFTPFFDKLAGTKKLKEQIKKGMTEVEIKATWQDDIKAFKQIRKKYLLYKDFES